MHVCVCTCAFIHNTFMLRSAPQYPLNTDDYQSLLAELEDIVQNHKNSIGSLPKAQLDPLDLSGKIAPCCNQATNCTCSAAQFLDEFALSKYRLVPSGYQG